jgi:hypothetical protein
LGVQGKEQPLVESCLTSRNFVGLPNNKIEKLWVVHHVELSQEEVVHPRGVKATVPVAQMAVTHSMYSIGLKIWICQTGKNLLIL